MHAFWLVLTYDLLEDRRIDDVIIKTFWKVCITHNSIYCSKDFKKRLKPLFCYKHLNEG